MAFQGSKGRGRGGIRRGNSRGGGTSSRGRGGASRGSGGFRGRGGKRPIFDSARLAQQKEEENDKVSPSDSESASEEPASEEESSSEDDDETLPTARPYSVLLQSLTANIQPHAKRRKLDHPQEPKIDTDNAAQPKIDQELEGESDLDEEKEDLDTAIDDVLEEGDSDEEDRDDPFDAHFADPEENILKARMQSLQNGSWTQERLSTAAGKMIVSIPNSSGPVLPSEVSTVSGPGELKLKQKLAKVISKQRPKFDDLEKHLAACMFSYKDLTFCERSPSNAERLRRMACLHAVNHIFKTRDHVIKNNSKLTKEGSENLDLRDQGFTRPKVLMILPTRESCCRMVNMITLLCEPDQQENRKRFEDSYSEKAEAFSDDKPADFRELFAGNDDDMFRLGLKFTRKTIKYFSQFYNSDIIFASPLGMRMALEGKDDKKGDYDFLSSIEIVIVDQADALLMQNWEHVEYIFEHLNLQPKEAHGCDFSRVRSWYLDNQAQYFRQVIALAAFNTPELNTMFQSQSKNWAGKVKLGHSYSGAIQDLGLKVKQTFSRLESDNFAADPDSRFEYFKSAIIPTLVRRSKDTAGTIIFLPSYLDFVRVRNHFSTSPDCSTLSFGSISEYTSVRDVARARSHFFSGRHSVLLYTERAHHFRRYQLRGVKRVIMYGLPNNPIFFKEMAAGYLGRSVQEGKLVAGEGGVRAIFSKWDVLKLERIVGTERVPRMINEKGDTFDFL